MRSRWWGLVIAAAAIGFSIWAYPRLPATVPTHWNLRGEPDGFSSRLLAVSLLPLVMVALAGMLQILPKIDPKGENYAKFASVYWLLVNGILLFLGLLHVSMLANGLGFPVSIPRVVPIGVGLLFVLIGSYLGQIEPNWFVGIRTPWTLSSDAVWRRTHRTGGRLFVLGGVLMMATAFLRQVTMVVVFVLTMALVAVIPVVQSYVLWKRERSS